jgi:uncharacterized repeat protein (TIGR02543 family)
MMNRTALYAAAALLLLFSACELLGPKPGADAGPEGKAAVRVAIAASGAPGRTALPAVALKDATAWELWGGEPSETQTLITDLSGTSTTVYLETGVWDFTVKGYKNEAVILQGTLREQAVSLDGSNVLTFTVVPHREGEGTFKITIELPAGHGITKAEVWQDDSPIEDELEPKGDTLVFEDDYPAGDYYFSVRLYKGKDLYGVVSEAAQVRANLLSATEYTLTAADLKMVYSIRYYLYGGELAGENPGSYRSVDAGFELPKPTRKGYTFEGWSADTIGGAAATDIPQDSEGDKTFHAAWSRVEYKIFYQPDDPEINYGDNPDIYTVESVAITLKVPPERDGFRFDGWYRDEQCHDQIIETPAIPAGSTGDQTFYAQWIRQFTITFESHGGSPVLPIKADVGTSVLKPDNPTRDDGYRFLGWFPAPTGGVAHTWPHDLTGDITLHAQWQPEGSIGITIKYQDGDILALGQEITISKSGSGDHDTGFTATVNDYFDVIQWRLNGDAIDGSRGKERSIRINAIGYPDGNYYLGVSAIRGGIYYSRDICFTVIN